MSMDLPLDLNPAAGSPDSRALPGRDEVARLSDLIRRIVVAMEQYSSSVGAQHDVHRTQLKALAVLMDHDPSATPMTPGTLGSALGLSSAATTALLDRLESAGHATRTRSLADRRVIDISITESALAVGRDLYLPLAARMQAALEPFGDDQLASANAVLSAILQAVVADATG
jgi:DNA-binding MarR family transcriptional regulator